MKKHVTVIGVLHIGRSVVQLLVGFIVMVTLVGSGIISQAPGEALQSKIDNVGIDLET